MHNELKSMESLPSLLLVDDDETFSRVLARALAKRGFEVRDAFDVPGAIALADENPPEYAVVDLKMPGDSGLILVQHLNTLDPHTKIVVLTGFSSVATAIEAIKLGATHYLAKPAHADEILAAFEKGQGDVSVSVNEKPMSVNRMEWEYIQRVLQEHDGNISATARALGMHRRTLQRKLFKHPAKE